MSLLNKFKTNSYCVGGRHYSGTNNISGAITSKGTKMLRESCTKYRRNKSMTVSDATIEAEISSKVLVKLRLTLERKLLIIQ